MVPNGWKVSTLGKLAIKIGSGVTPKGGSESYKTSGIPLIRSQNVLWGNLDLSDVAYIDRTQHKKMKGSIVFQGDVLLNITGASIGRAAISHLDEANVNQHVCIIRSDILDAGYLRDFLLSYYGQKQIEQFQAGGNRQGLNFEQIKSFKIPVPPLSEQKKIAKILSTWDKVITTTEQLLANSQQQKKSLIQQLLTGKKRLLDRNGVRFSGEWQTYQLSDVISSLDSGVSVNGVEQDVEASHYVLKTSCLSDGVFAAEQVKRVVEEKEITRLKEPLRNDSILISRMNTPALVGANSYVEYAPDNTYLPDRLWQVKATQGKVLMRWLAFWFSSEKTRTALSDLASGTSGSMKNISKKSVLAMSIQCPSLEEQQKIAAVLTTADQEISALQQKLNALKQEKKALMQILLTGKRRVHC